MRRTASFQKTQAVQDREFTGMRVRKSLLEPTNGPCTNAGQDYSSFPGFLRFSLFWGTVPYLDLIWVLQNDRRQGVGSVLFDFWEREMKKRGAKVLMTSSVRDELEP
jgi:GNAT superfamily N-acetyltransferase